MPTEYDDADQFDESDEPNDGAPPFPRTVQIAGVIWILEGALLLLVLGAVLLLIDPKVIKSVVEALKKQDPGANRYVEFLPFLYGIVQIVLGYRCVKGKERGMVFIPIMSIVIGVLPMIAGISFFARLAQRPEAPEFLVLAISCGILSLFGLGMLVPGVFALVGHAKYRNWRRWQKDQLRHNQTS